MQDMIKKIIEMDEEARKLKAQAEQEKLQSEQEVLKAKQQIHEEYLQRARVRAEKNAKTEQEAADAQWEKTQAEHKAVLDRLNKEFKDNCDGWVDVITRNVVEQF